MPYFQTKQFVTALSFDVTRWRRTGIFKMRYFQNEGHYRPEDLSRDKFLGILSNGGNKNLADVVKFDFRIL